MASSEFGFAKKERLTGKKSIEELFSKGFSLRFQSFLIKYSISRQVIGINRILISVPKKKFRRAVDRNLIKRRIREAYRLNKHLLFSAHADFVIAFVYLSPSVLSFDEIQAQLIKILSRLKDIKEMNHAEEN